MKWHVWIRRVQKREVLRIAVALGLVGTVFLAGGGALFAVTIGVNFYGTHPNGASQMATQTAGAPGYVQTNWNDVTMANFSSGSNVNALGTPLVDKNGVATDITFGYASDGAWAWAFSSTADPPAYTATPDTMLLSGYSLVAGNDDHHYVFFGNVPAGEYKVVLYTVGPFVRQSTYTVSNGEGTNEYVSAPMLDSEYLGLVDPPGPPGLGYQMVLDPTDNLDPLQTSSYVVMDAAPNANGNIGVTLRTPYFDAWSAVQLVSVGGDELPGDFNHDDKVDAADYTVWRDGFGTTYTPDDYGVWKTHFGESAGSGAGSIGVASAVPEPGSVWLLVAGVVWGMGNGTRRCVRRRDFAAADATC